jgi:hypothetical protein
MVQRRKIRGSDYVTAPEAARRLGCSHPSIHEAIRSGKVKAITVISGDSVIYAIQWKDVRGFAPRAYVRA